VELEVGDCLADEVVVADVPVLPPATAVANDARLAVSADMIAMLSPADLFVVDETDTPVCPATTSMAENNEFHCEALTVFPADTVATCDSPSPYTPDPVPPMWLIPKGLELLPTKALYSSSKIVSPAEYAIFLFNPYHAFC